LGRTSNSQLELQDDQLEEPEANILEEFKEELRELAQLTVTEVDTFNWLFEIPYPSFYQRQVRTNGQKARMKKLTTLTLDRLEEARGEAPTFNNWAIKAEVVSKSNYQFSLENLNSFETTKTQMKNALDDLKNVAARFLNQPNVTFREYALVIQRERAKVAENLLEAERDILKVSELKPAFEEDYFPAYKEAKSLLKNTRQELRELAFSTGTKVRDLKIVLEHLDESNNSLLFKIFIDRMKDTRIDPLEMLKESRATYESSVKTFENTISFIATKIRESSKLGFSSRFDKTLNLLIDVLSEEIEMISIWTQSAKTVSRNIDNNSEDVLIQFQSVRTIFMNGLDDLKNATDTFLGQTKDIVRLN